MKDDIPDSYDCGMRKTCQDGPFCGAVGATLASEITSRILEPASGAFGKLVLVSSLCNRCAGAYHHPEFEQVVPSCLASLVLRKIHEQAFSKWLAMILEEQWKEVSEYLATPGAGKTVQDKAPGGSWELLLPEGTREPERELFLSDLKLVLSLLEA